METFSALLAICAGNSPVPGEFPTQRPVTRSFDVFFDLRMNKQLSKQWWGWWFETQSCPLWRHSNVLCINRQWLFPFWKWSRTVWGHFCWHGIAWIPAWISNHMPIKIWDKITHPFPNFSGCTVAIWESISNFTPNFMMDIITFSMLGLELNYFDKRAL